MKYSDNHYPMIDTRILLLLIFLAACDQRDQRDQRGDPAEVGGAGLVQKGAGVRESTNGENLLALADENPTLLLEKLEKMVSVGTEPPTSELVPALRRIALRSPDKSLSLRAIALISDETMRGEAYAALVEQFRNSDRLEEMVRLWQEMPHVPQRKVLIGFLVERFAAVDVVEAARFVESVEEYDERFSAAANFSNTLNNLDASTEALGRYVAALDVVSDPKLSRLLEDGFSKMLSDLDVAVAADWLVSEASEPVVEAVQGFVYRAMIGEDVSGAKSLFARNTERLSEEGRIRSYEAFGKEFGTHDPVSALKWMDGEGTDPYRTAALKGVIAGAIAAGKGVELRQGLASIIGELSESEFALVEELNVGGG